MKKLISLLLAMTMLLSSLVVPAFAENAADADVIVIGAGGGGLSAALEAAAQGAQKVIVLEMTAKTGGALNYTSGSMSAAGTIIQKEEGVEDSVDAYVADILRIGGDLGGQPNEALVRVYANEATAVFDWLYEAGLKDNAYSVDRATGNRAVFAPEHALFTIQRTYKPSPDDKANYKSAAHEVLDSLIAQNDVIEVKLNTKAVELVANDKGQVLSVVTADGQTLTASKGIVVTTGGYSANGKLMAEFVPYGNYYLAGGIIDCRGVAKGISIDGGRETVVRNCSIKGSIVGLHIKRGANSGSSDSDISGVNIVGCSKPNAVGVLVEGYDNTFTNMRIGGVHVGFILKSGANSLRNIHPLYYGRNEEYQSSCGFIDEAGTNFFDFCYSDEFATAFRTTRSRCSIFTNCFAYWYSKRGTKHVVFKADGRFESNVVNLNVGIGKHNATNENIILEYGESGGKGLFDNLYIRDPKLITDNAHKAFVE